MSEVKQPQTDTVRSTRGPGSAGSLVTWLKDHQPSDETVLVIMALVVGVGAGFGAIVFRWLINSFRTLAFEGGRQALAPLGRYYVILIPAIGGLFVGPMIYRFAREAKGHGVPEVMEAVVLHGGRIRPIVVVIKALASSICIGTGGSAGREGPIVQIGSALGSTIGQAFRMPDSRTRTLVACGAGAGIAGTFNAPVAGVLFALEIILGEFTVSHFSTVVISSVTASVIVRIFLGNSPAFAVPAYAMHSPWELVIYLILGIVAAPVGVAFIRLLYATEDVFDAWGFPEYLKPVIGGLGVGAIGLYAPEVFGVGYETIETVLHNEIVFSTVAILLIGKILATSLTLGSGGSGGVFAPSLFMGAMLGGSIGELAHRALPNITATSGAYALVGMAAVFAAGARAPMTAIVILFEMTGDYQIILPLMLSTVVATLLARRLEPQSIYTLKLARRGVQLERDRYIDVMHGVEVGEVMTQRPDVVRADMHLQDLADTFTRTRHHGFPVLDGDGRLLGVVAVQDLERATAEGSIQERTVADITERQIVTAYPNDPLSTALGRMSQHEFGRIPVVDPEDPQKLVGLLRRGDIVRAYRHAILRRLEEQHRTESLRLGHLTDMEIVEIPVSSDMSAAGRQVADLDLPPQALITTVQRGDEVIIAHGETVIQPGDTVILLTNQAAVADLRRAFED